MTFVQAYIAELEACYPSNKFQIKLNKHPKYKGVPMFKVGINGDFSGRSMSADDIIEATKLLQRKH